LQLTASFHQLESTIVPKKTVTIDHSKPRFSVVSQWIAKIAENPRNGFVSSDSHDELHPFF
jgi:hypothetical protein